MLLGVHGNRQNVASRPINEKKQQQRSNVATTTMPRELEIHPFDVNHASKKIALPFV